MKLRKRSNLRGLVVHRAGDRDGRAEFVLAGLRGELQDDLQKLRLREGFELLAQPLVELKLLLVVVLLMLMLMLMLMLLLLLVVRLL